MHGASTHPTKIDSEPGPPCPRCATPLVSEYGAAAWCERCEWGLDAYEPPEAAGWLARRTGAVLHRIAYRLTLSQFGRLVGTLPTRPGLTGTRLLVITISIMLFALTAALAVTGGWLVIYGFPSLTVLPGLLLLGIAWYVVPRFGRLGSDADRLGQAEAPTLHALVARVADAVGAGAPHIIVVNSGFGAATAALGLRRRRVLFLGLALWGSLAPQQRVALLGHELGHFANGDLRRGVLTQPAFTTLGRLSDLFRPAWSWESIDETGLMERMSAMVMRVLAWWLWLAHLCVLALALRDGQQAEYFADRRAGRLAGTRATVELLDLLVLRDVAASVVASRARAGETAPGWRAAAAELLQQRPRLPRLRQLSVRWESSLFTSHPPAGLRSRLIEAAGWCEPTLHLGEEESARVDAELGRHYQRYRRDIAHSDW